MYGGKPATKIRNHVMGHLQQLAQFSLPQREDFDESLDRDEVDPGQQQSSSLAMVNNTASAFYNEGQYEKALEWGKQALAEEEKSLGIDHPNTLTMASKIAHVYENQGQYSRALEWYERVLAGREKALGADHPPTLDSVKNMALFFINKEEIRRH
ncbi:hypothetical protein BDZ91DRAFT_788180 [Kalaharituber pfeilii]|nr:hypothetical protein BDZ91DRAFT_788180 [Kalaharituber pfeilii]